MPTEEELAKWQRVRPIMNELLQGKGLVKLAEDKVHVAGLKGPLEAGWQQKVEAFASGIFTGLAEHAERLADEPASTAQEASAA